MPEWLEKIFNSLSTMGQIGLGLILFGAALPFYTLSADILFFKSVRKEAIEHFRRKYIERDSEYSYDMYTSATFLDLCICIIGLSLIMLGISLLLLSLFL